jgi:hypothetical protein
MAAALQAPVADAGPAQDLLDLPYVHGLAAVAGAKQRQLLAAQAEVLEAATLHEGQRLQRLQGGAGEGHPVRVAGLRTYAAARIRDRQRAEVDALARAAAEGFDQRDQGGHRAILPAAAHRHLVTVAPRPPRPWVASPLRHRRACR